MTIRLTPGAAQRIRRQIESRGRGVGLRVGVKKSGCSGFAYTLDYADAVGAEDAVFESEGATVVVAKADLAALAGITVDFRKNGLNEAFTFQNPNAEALCGCGESFALKKTA
ncbi:MAG TPA: iron-sulfur cluster assembly accessory protein [Candidatus Binatia bacterium]|nr:iron-sulfur cluster assembly accessory protein [Candidatus Binatia bacterium]